MRSLSAVTWNMKSGIAGAGAQREKAVKFKV
jgi:hypothetical protein